MTEVRLWSASDVSRGLVPAEHAHPLRIVLGWIIDYLNAPHPGLGRNGPVCPYTASALRQDLLYLTVGAADDLADHFTATRERYERLAADLPTADRQLLALLVVLPAFDHARLDGLQQGAKGEYVRRNLMIGQFHPSCAEPGLWNSEFRPLRSPVPLLAIRQMREVDLPFLVSPDHLAAYFARYTPQLPLRTRKHLIDRLVRASLDAPLRPKVT